MQTLTIESLFVGSLLSFKNHKEENNKKKVVLLGQGWLAKGFLEHIDKRKFYVINITRHEFVNTPMILKTINLKNNYKKNNNFIKKIDEIIIDEINKIDLENKNLQLKYSNLSWKNGYLVCGLGSNEDIGKKWFETINKIRFDSNKKSYCIIGSGPTGTELAFYLSDKKYDVTILDMIDNSKIYNYISEKGKNIILNRLDNSQIKLLSSTPFTESMKSKYDEVIFATGSRPNNLTFGWKLTTKLNLENYNDVFFGGDCVHYSLLPKNAQVAYQQGKYIAERLNDNNHKKDDFKFENNGIALYSGNETYYVETKILENEIKTLIPSYLIDLYYFIFR